MLLTKSIGRYKEPFSSRNLISFRADLAGEGSGTDHTGKIDLWFWRGHPDGTVWKPPSTFHIKILEVTGGHSFDVWHHYGVASVICWFYYPSVLPSCDSLQGIAFRHGRSGYLEAEAIWEKTRINVWCFSFHLLHFRINSKSPKDHQYSFGWWGGRGNKGGKGATFWILWRLLFDAFS